MRVAVLAAPPPPPPTAPTPRSSPHSIPVTVLFRLESGSGRGGAWALPPQAPGLPTPQAEGSCPGHMSPERAPAPAKRPCGPWTRGSHPRFLWMVRAASGPGLQTCLSRGRTVAPPHCASPLWPQRRGRGGPAHCGEGGTWSGGICPLCWLKGTLWSLPRGGRPGGREVW